MKLLGFVCFAAVMFLAACSSVADGDETELMDLSSNSRPRSSAETSISSSVDDLSSSSREDTSIVNTDSLLAYYGQWTKVEATSLKKGSVSYSVNAFEIMKTEVTQSLYRTVMDSLPVMDKVGDSIPVANINWYDAVLFCNAFSKLVGLDTAYVYEMVGDSRYLYGLEIDYGVESVRLPTEMEWEIAYRAGTTTTYYWDNDVASKYAYYAQTSGPVKVGQYKPNAYGLYDMGGNVAEWVNDWFGPKPTKSQSNYTGAETGSAKIARGGGWSDIARTMAADSTVKKDPLYQSDKMGLRLVHSVGF